MSFTDLLRKSRSGRVAVVHKFLTQYDPNTTRIHAFVEGHADQAFYRVHVERFASSPREVCFYNCEGKQNVFESFATVIARYPNCERVLFFVDKDIDDILGRAWPADPRIFVTDCYSIENFVVCMDAIRSYLHDLVKVRRVDVDLEPALARIGKLMAEFHMGMLPVMAWILLMRRGGARVLLTDVTPAAFLKITDSGMRRRGDCRVLKYLHRVTGTPVRPGVWRQLRAACGELKGLSPERYIRGKFEAWWLVQSVRLVVDGLSTVARELGGTVAVGLPLCEQTVVELLASRTPIPPSLDRFLQFHLARRAPRETGVPLRVSIVRRVAAWLGGRRRP